MASVPAATVQLDRIDPPQSTAALADRGVMLGILVWQEGGEYVDVMFRWWWRRSTRLLPSWC